MAHCLLYVVAVRKGTEIGVEERLRESIQIEVEVDVAEVYNVYES